MNRLMKDLKDLENIVRDRDDLIRTLRGIDRDIGTFEREGNGREVRRLEDVEARVKRDLDDLRTSFEEIARMIISNVDRNDEDYFRKVIGELQETGRIPTWFLREFEDNSRSVRRTDRRDIWGSTSRDRDPRGTGYIGLRGNDRNDNRSTSSLFVSGASESRGQTRDSSTSYISLASDTRRERPVPTETRRYSEPSSENRHKSDKVILNEVNAMINPDECDVKIKSSPYPFLVEDNERVKSEVRTEQYYNNRFKSIAYDAYVTNKLRDFIEAGGDSNTCNKVGKLGSKLEILDEPDPTNVPSPINLDKTYASRIMHIFASTNKQLRMDRATNILTVTSNSSSKMMDDHRNSASFEFNGVYEQSGFGYVLINTPIVNGHVFFQPTESDDYNFDDEKFLEEFTKKANEDVAAFLGQLSISMSVEELLRTFESYTNVIPDIKKAIGMHLIKEINNAYALVGLTGFNVITSLNVDAFKKVQDVVTQYMSVLFTNDNPSAKIEFVNRHIIYNVIKPLENFISNIAFVKSTLRDENNEYGCAVLDMYYSITDNRNVVITTNEKFKEVMKWYITSTTPNIVNKYMAPYLYDLLEGVNVAFDHFKIYKGPFVPKSFYVKIRNQVEDTTATFQAYKDVNGDYVIVKQ